MKRINLAHGDGGELTQQLIHDVFVKEFGHEQHAVMDAAAVSLNCQDISVSTDSFVVNPLFFPGGNIGKLAVSGTVNDLAVSGAVPKFLTVSFIIEEGFLISDLKMIVGAMAEEAKKADVQIVSGDTKVVEKNSADGLYINTTGIGMLSNKQCVNPNTIQEGDVIIVSGSIGDHGIAILAARNELGLITNIQSDCASLNHMTNAVFNAAHSVRIMRDPTRGGLATTLVEICEDFQVTMEIEESALPIHHEVRGACDILGFEPLYLANEGKIIMICAKEEEHMILDILRNFHEGQEAQVIGYVTKKEKGQLLLKTPLGSTRRLNRLSGMMLPRIC
ncbi:hydrogenase expression/formation protein HypE [Bacillus taeanensis]|uniref:Hydrogenase expression/formation protein HypE n=1 Tax=Bacillus taeanensis TaxID=273032 RepID=A0A366XYI5_9BACI|nr:hydrogenase expression/formation protein HypE [Bacillus taeanensis]RBW70967.1 hydrogenase expression/formation protein HypE [Bacillus taeanensis]